MVELLNILIGIEVNAPNQMFDLGKEGWDMNTSNYVRPMGVFEIYKSAFNLYRRLFLSLGMINLVQILGIMLFQISAGGASALNINLGVRCLSLLAELGFLVVLNLVSAAAFVAASNAVLGRPVSFKGAYGRVLSSQLIGKLTGATLLAGVIMDIGFVLLVIPAIVFFVWFAFVPFVVVLEKLGGRAALRRSRELVRGNFWRVLGGYLLLGVLPYGVLTDVVAFKVAGYLGFSMFDGMPFTLVITAVTSVFAFVFGPFLNLVVTLFYYDLRTRKENFNEVLLEQEMGYTGLPEMVTI